MKTQKLFPYQRKAVKEIVAAFEAGHRSVLFDMYMGGGKTEVLFEVARILAKAGVFTAHRDSLVNDEKILARINKLRARGIQFDNVTMQSLRNFESEFLALIGVDEAHRAECASYRNFLAKHPKAKVLGLTGTPRRMDGKSLMSAKGGTFDVVVKGPTMKQLVKLNRIMVPDHYTSPYPISEIKLLSSGEVDEQDATDKAIPLVGRVVEHYKELALGRQALVIACSIRHAELLADKFNDPVDGLGVGSARVIVSDYSATTVQHKDAITNREAFVNNEYKIAVQVGMLLEGFDYPELGVVIGCRPTTSIGLYHQFANRCTRFSPNKATPLFLDHAALFYLHGGLDADIDWETGIAKPTKPRKCPKPSCKDLVSIPAKAKACPKCGYVFTKSDGDHSSNTGHQHAYITYKDKLIRTEEALLLREANKLKDIERAALRSEARADVPADFSVTLRPTGKWLAMYSKKTNGKTKHVTLTAAQLTREAAVKVAQEAARILNADGMEAMLVFKESMRKKASSKKGEGKSKAELTARETTKQKERMQNDPEYRAKILASKRARDAKRAAKIDATKKGKKS